MKCVERDEKLNLLLDGEAEDWLASETKAHLKKCSACRNEFILRQTTRNFLKNQPPVLPEKSFDNRMLRAFENHRKPMIILPERSSAKWLVFSNPFFKFGLTAAVFAFGVGLAFLLGRMSVSNNQRVISSSPDKGLIEQAENQNPSVQTSNEQNISQVEKEKIITRYIKVPVVKEKIVEKRIYLRGNLKSVSRRQTETFAKTKIEQSGENIAEQFNLRDLQPIAASYRIIKKGGNNE